MRQDAASNICSLRTLLAALLLTTLPDSAALAQESPSAQVARLADELVARRRDSGPAAALTIQQAVRDSTFGHALVTRARAVDTTALSHEERLTLAIVEWEGRGLESRPELYWYEFSLLPAISPFNPILVRAQGHQFHARADLDTYLTLLDSATNVARGIVEKSLAQEARGIILPRGQVDVLLPYYQPLAQATDANPFAVSAARLASVASPAADSFRVAVAKRIASGLAPQAAALVQYLDRDVRQRGPTAVGMWQYPGGKAAYRTALVLQTALPGVTPESVHAHGVSAIAAIDSQMARLRNSLGFRGTKREFDERLRHDPRFYEATADAVANRFMASVHRMEPLIARYFGHVPRAPYGVRRLDASLEATQTYGHYAWGAAVGDSGFYYFNASSLDQRSMLPGAAIIYHELIPGHHFQVNLARENEALPALRHGVYYPGFGEGWGEYTSSVIAREAGLYSDPYDLYGRLAFDAFLASRLVVDTGMNYFGWSRERAMAYMHEHTLESDVQIDTETWRYSVRQPAQATAYRMGRDVIIDLRHRAERELGTRFDLRSFHDAMIGSGSLPLFLVQRHMEWWIESQRARVAR